MIRRVALWVGRILLAFVALVALGITGLFLFPLGCPITKHLPETVTDATCDKAGNFPELKYEIKATATKAEYDVFVEALQREVADAEWTFKTWDNRVSVTFYNSTIMGWAGWQDDGQLRATWHQF